jgi:hypothetical protein
MPRRPSRTVGVGADGRLLDGPLSVGIGASSPSGQDLDIDDGRHYILPTQPQQAPAAAWQAAGLFGHINGQLSVTRPL